MNKLQIEYVDINSIKPYKNNAKEHPEEQIEQIKKSIEQFGMDDPIGIWKDEIVEGHGRLIACKELGYTEVPIIRLDHLTDEERKAYTLAHNKLTMNSGFDMDMLSKELESITNIDMSSFGFDEDLSMNANTEIEEDNFDVEDNIPDEPKAKLGDIYQLGEHRLMCGDSTSEEDVQKLGGGCTLDLLFTDPPYNVSIVGGSHAIPVKDRIEAGEKTIKNDEMTNEDFKEFLNRAFANANRLLKDGGAYYVWYATREQVNFEEQLNANGLPVREQLIWVKNSLVLGRQDYQWMHEPCMYGWKDGAAHYFTDNRKLTTIIEDKLDFESMKKEDLKKLLEEIYEFPSTIIRENRPVKSDLHPTMKPIRMCAKLISNSTKPGETVLDLFGGSGSTLIACEQLGRKCYMMEYDPKYVDVIIKRWEDFTGEKAIKIN
jgi:site-specific DNA-methyltransferase (adenine-specific)